MTEPALRKREKKWINIRKRDLLAWCAGFFDGEGCFYLAKRGNHRYMRAVIVQKDRRLLERFVEIVEVGKVDGPNRRGIHRIVYHGADKVLFLYELLAPYLGPQKTEQFEAKLNEYLVAKREFGRVRK